MATAASKKKKPSRKAISGGKGLTSEKVQAMVQEEDQWITEMRQILKENAELQKETDRIVKENAERQKETERQLKERAEELDRQMKENAERQKETERQLKESAERLDRQMQETDKRLGKLGNRFGEMVEYMVKPNLIAKFHELGFVFEKAYSDATIEDKTNNIYAEIDITLENGDKVMIVEIKSKPTTEDVIEHIERMQKVRKHGDLHGDRRKFLGAIGGMVFNDNVKKFAMKKGFYVIEPSGETFIITAPEGEYSPMEW